MTNNGLESTYVESSPGSVHELPQHLYRDTEKTIRNLRTAERGEKYEKDVEKYKWVNKRMAGKTERKTTEK
jgi:hypothetical protein